jgi:hypothetical protein
MKKIVYFCFGLVLAQVASAQNSADFVSLSAPASVAPGATFTATITMRNNSGVAWTAADQYFLGSESPRNHLTWGTHRVALPVDPVNPGDNAAFTTTFTAPTIPGIYTFAWGMVQEGIQWFGPVASQTIRVGSGRFTPGDLVVLQTVATASDTISANGTAMVLKNLSRSSFATTFQVALPINGPDSVVSGTSPFSGMIDLSTDGNYLVIGGYNTPLPYSTTVEAAGSPVPRVVGTVNSGGRFVLNATTTTGFAGGTFRGVVSDGAGNFWGGAQNSGIYYFGTNFAPVQISPAGLGAFRNMIMVNGKPYFSTSQFPVTSTFGIAAFTNAAPTTPQEPVLIIDSGNAVTGKTGTANPKGFYVNSNLTIAYVADLRASPNGGLYRYNGTGTGLAGSWTYAYTLANNLFPSGGFQEVLVDFSGANPTIYATTGAGVTVATGAGTNLVTAVDTGPASTFTMVATAPVNAPFRGLTFAPKAVSLSIAKSGSDVVITWTGGGALLSASSVTGPYLPVAGTPTSPYTNAPSGTAQFYAVGSP